MALELFATALSPFSGDEAVDGKDKTQLYVHMHVDLGTTVLADPSDADLFALVAVRTHAGLDERELVDVTNMSPGLIRSTVKHLEALALLKRVGEQVVIVSKNLPRINRTLRRRRYIPWEV